MKPICPECNSDMFNIGKKNYEDPEFRCLECGGRFIGVEDE